MVELQRRCLEQCPDISLLPEGFYFSPSFAEGRNIVCALDSSGAHVGHGMVCASYVHPRLNAWMLWMDLRVDPSYDDGDELRDRLLGAITGRAREVWAELGKPAMLYATYFSRGQASIDYLKSKGFEHFESIYQMRRDLADPIPDLSHPAGVECRAWRMETESEQRRYLEAYDAAFENESKPLAQLQHFMKSGIWSEGTTCTAFEGDRVVGSVMAYFDPDSRANPDRIGATEYVFVRPEWRRRGLARYLLAQSMRYLKEQDLAYAHLEVVGNNTRALRLYEAMGYERLREEISLGLWLDAGTEMSG